MLILTCMSCMCFAHHTHKPMYRPAFRPIYRPNNIHHRPIYHQPRHVHHWHSHHHNSILPFTIGALTGYTVSQLITPQPKTVVVQQPVVVAPTQTTVWEPAHYEDQIQSNGTIIRVWIPGRYVMKVITP